jgi:hypothetical protein
MAEKVLSRVEPSLFEEHSLQVINRLRRAVADVVRAITVPGNRPVDLATGLKIDNKLAWKISRVIDAADPFAAARYVPGASGFGIFLRAAKRSEVSKGVIASAKAAFDSFDELIHTHADSRKAFDMMLAGYAREDRARADIEHRKQMFEGSSYVWGVQARAALRIDLLAPSADPAMFDCATIRGFSDLRRLRPNVPWRIARAYSADAAGDIHTSFVREAIDSSLAVDSEASDLPLMPAFCSKPLPQCRRVNGPMGIEYELVEGAVGNTGVLTCIMGEIIRKAEPRYRTERYPDISQMFRLRTPCEFVVFDVLIHRALFGRRITPGFTLYSDLFAKQFGPRYRQCDRLPVQEQVEYLGRGRAVAATSEIARYADMIQEALDRGGWNGAEFDVYRVQMRYPPIPSNLVIAHDLPEPPNS